MLSKIQKLIEEPLEKENIKIPVNNSVDLFLLYVSEDEKKSAAYLTNELRMNGFIVETDYLNRSLKAQFKQADRLNSKFLIILNDEDLKNDTVKVKNNSTKEEELVEVDYLLYYLDEQLLDSNDCCGDDCDCHDEISF